MHIVLPLILLLSVSSSVMAQSDTEQPPPELTQQVTVAGSRDPDWKPYRKMLDGIDAFDRYHFLAPQAQLKFILRPQQPQLTASDLKLRIVGENVNIEVPIASDLTFSVPRDESAAKDDADLRLRVSPQLRSHDWNGVEFYEREAAGYRIPAPDNPADTSQIHTFGQSFSL